MNNIKTKIIEHKCFACGYEYKEEMSYSYNDSCTPWWIKEQKTIHKVLIGDEPFKDIVFEKSSIRFGGGSYSSDAYACPKCKTMKLA